MKMLLSKVASVLLGTQLLCAIIASTDPYESADSKQIYQCMVVVAL